MKKKEDGFTEAMVIEFPPPPWKRDDSSDSSDDEKMREPIEMSPDGSPISDDEEEALFRPVEPFVYATCSVLRHEASIVRERTFQHLCVIVSLTRTCGDHWSGLVRAAATVSNTLTSPVSFVDKWMVVSETRPPELCEVPRGNDLIFDEKKRPKLTGVDWTWCPVSGADLAKPMPDSRVIDRVARNWLSLLTVEQRAEPVAVVLLSNSRKEVASTHNLCADFNAILFECRDGFSAIEAIMYGTDPLPPKREKAVGVGLPPRKYSDVLRE